MQTTGLIYYYSAGCVEVVQVSMPHLSVMNQESQF